MRLNRKEKKEKIYKRIDAEAKALGFKYELKHYILLNILLSGIAILVGIVFKLKPIPIAIIVVFGLLLYPSILLSKFESRKNEYNFSNLTGYMENMIVSFKKTPKILVALRNTREFCEGKMLYCVNRAIYTIENDASTPDIYRKALNFVEDEFKTSRLKSLHKFLISVEQGNSVSYQRGIDNLYYDIHSWITRVLGFRKNLQDRKIKIIITITASLLIAAYFTNVLVGLEASFKGANITQGFIYQTATTVFIMVLLGMYVILETKINGVRVVEDLSKFDEKKLLERLSSIENYDKKKEIKNALIAALIVGAVVFSMGLIIDSKLFKFGAVVMFVVVAFIGYNSNNSNISYMKNELIKEFPTWLRDVSVNLQNMVVVSAVEATAADTSPLMKNFSLRFIDAIRRDPISMKPYNNFFGKIEMPQLITSIKALYSIQSVSREESIRQLNDLSIRNQELISQSEELMLNDSIAGIGFLIYIPMLAMSLKLMIDMVDMMLHFMSAF